MFYSIIRDYFNSLEFKSCLDYCNSTDCCLGSAGGKFSGFGDNYSGFCWELLGIRPLICWSMSFLSNYCIMPLCLIVSIIWLSLLNSYCCWLISLLKGGSITDYSKMAPSWPYAKLSELSTSKLGS